MIVGEEAFCHFDEAVKSILSVPRAEILRRDAEYRQRAKQNPKRRGPKPKPETGPGERLPPPTS